MSPAAHIPDGPLVVVKVGSNSITHVLDDGTQAVDSQRISDIAEGVSKIRDNNYRVIVVTSGAVAGGMYKEHFAKRPGIGERTRLSSLAAIGQSQLMFMYSGEFAKRSITVAQGLPTQDDFHREVVNRHMRDTLDDLLSLGCVPILNENDFTSFAEMRFGDNDIIAALVGILCEADHLVIFTVEDGIMSANPHRNEDAQLLSEINDLTPEMFDDSQDKSAAGSGGINSKLFVGDLCRYSRISTAITHIDQARHIDDIINGEIACTRFAIRSDTHLPIEYACDVVREQSRERSDSFFSVSEYLKSHS